MCYKSNLNDDSSVAKMATEDITVWKVAIDAGTEIMAPFQEYIYTGKKYHRAEKLDVGMFENQVYIFEGLHSYINLKAALTSHIHFKHEITCYCKCYIPKGSVYFTDNKEVVSQDLVFVKAYVEAPWYYRMFGVKLKCIHTW